MTNAEAAPTDPTPSRARILHKAACAIVLSLDQTRSASDPALRPEIEDLAASLDVLTRLIGGQIELPETAFRPDDGAQDRLARRVLALRGVDVPQFSAKPGCLAERIDVFAHMIGKTADDLEASMRIAAGRASDGVPGQPAVPITTR